MIRKTKTNGETAPEIVAARGEGLPDDLVAQLEASQYGPVSQDDRRVEWIGASELEAAVTTPRPGTQMLYIGRPMPGRQPPCAWYPVSRFDERKVGSHDIIEYRPVRTDLGARILAALEIAHGRDGLELYNVDQHPHAEPVELEGVALVTLGSGSRILHAKYRGVWQGICRIHKTEPGPNPGPAPGPGEAFPKLSIA